MRARGGAGAEGGLHEARLLESFAEAMATVAAAVAVAVFYRWALEGRSVDLEGSVLSLYIYHAAGPARCVESNGAFP